MAAKSPIEDAVAKWHSRAQQYKQAGGNLADLHDVAQQDLNNVRQGHSPMADEAALAAMSGALGKPIIPDKAPKTGLTSLPGNVIGDMGNMLSGMTIGLARLGVTSAQDVAHGHAPRLLRQSWEPFQHAGNSPEDKAWQAAHGYEDIQGKHGLSHLAGELRNLAHDPAISMLPGATTVAGLTTHKGREELLRHPFNTAVDILPLAKGVGAVAYLAQAGELTKTARAGLEGGKISKAYLDAAKALGEMPGGPKLGDLGPDLGKRIAIYDSLLAHKPDPVTGMETYAGFHPVKGLIQGIPAARHLETMIADSTRMFSHDIREKIFRPKNEAERIAFEVETNKLYQAVPELADMSEEDRHKLGTTVTDAAFNLENPETYNGFSKEMLGHVQAYAKELENLRLSQGMTTRLMMKIGDKTIPLEFIKNGKTHRAFLKTVEQDNLITRIQKDIADITDHIKSGVDDRTKSRLSAQRDKLGTELQKVMDAKKKAQMDFHQAALEDVPINLIDPVQQTLIKNAHTVAEDFMAHNLIKIKDAPTFEKMLSENAPLAAYKKILTADGKDPKGMEYFTEHMNDIRGFWQDLVAQGAAPVYLARVAGDPNAALRRAGSISFVERSGADLVKQHLESPPTRLDALWGLTAAGIEIYREKASNIWVKGIMDTMSQSQEMAQQYAEKSLLAHSKYRKMQATNSEFFQMKVDEAIRRGMVPLREGKGLLGTPGTESAWKGVLPTDRLVTKAVADAIYAIMDEKDHRLPVTKAIDKATGLYKFEVMTGPRHTAHIAFGGLAMMLMQGSGSLLHILEAIKNYHDIRAGMPEMFAKGADFSEGEAVKIQAGGTLARFFKKMMGEKAQEKAVELGQKVIGEDSYLHRFDEYMLQIQRSAVALNVAHGHANLLNPANVAVREEALKQVYKTLVDTEAMAPWERTTLRQIIPFYAFTKHIIKYTLTYPNDHPIAAAILNRISNIEQTDRNTMLPQTFDFLFTLGHKNAQGEQTTVDFRAFDPFRSGPDLGSLQGFVSGLNPFMQGIMEASGANPLTASPDLYPELTVDQQTGAIIGKRDNVAIKLTKDFIPGFQIFDHYLGIQNRTKQIRQGNKAAFDKAGWQAFNMPIAVVRRSLAADRARYERNKLKVLQAQVTKAQQTGNFTELKDYPLVPYQGTFVSPQIIQTKYDAAAATLRRAGLTPASIKAYLPKTSAAKRKATLMQLEQMLADNQGG